MVKQQRKRGVNMTTRISDAYITNRSWFRSVLNNQPVVLCRTSALECLQLFNGYAGEKTIDVYTKSHGSSENVNYRILNSFDNIEIVRIGDISCTSANQTFNDMLSDFNNIDEQSLIEALATYYYANNESFDGLNIIPENTECFESIRNWAIEYYDD
ncbi:MAG: hypothetical protein LBC86_09280 [Oscillospiraceae bacterium]|jgi:hypothetical protein|nr:hypothetical protein [Oscillospiraceae bacterium]